jgi:CHAD domain-containing protein
MLADIDVTELDATSLTALMDMLQKHLGDVHQAVVDSWFLPDEHE